MSNVLSLAGITRRRKALAVAFLPYLLLSVFVDFVHLHRLIVGPMAPSSLSEHVTATVPGGSKLPETSCAICQWQRADTGMQTSVTDEPTRDVIAAVATVSPSLIPLKTEFGLHDFRGPPPSFSL